MDSSSPGGKTERAAMMEILDQSRFIGMCLPSPGLGSGHKFLLCIRRQKSTASCFQNQGSNMYSIHKRQDSVSTGLKLHTGAK